MITTLTARDTGLERKTITYDQALSVLGQGGRARAGNGWMVRCPVHDDSTPSLKIAQSSGGTLLLHCKAGCSFIDVMGALGERVGAYNPAPIPSVPSRQTHTAVQRGDSTRCLKDVWGWWVEKTGIPQDWWEDNGVTVRGGNVSFGFGKIRGREMWKIRTPSGRGKYRWDPAGGRYPKPSLWPVPEEDLGDIIITEGETDCATLHHIGYSNAYANTKGASSDIGKALLPLQSRGLRSVTVCYDLDETGIREAAKWVERLNNLGIPAREAVLPVPFDAMMEGVKDVNELWHWVEHDREEMRELLTPWIRE